MKETKDFIGNTIKVGDEVGFMTVSYRSLARGIVIKINEKKLTIQENPAYEPTQQFHNQVIKLIKEKI